MQMDILSDVYNAFAKIIILSSIYIMYTFVPGKILNRLIKFEKRLLRVALLMQYKCECIFKYILVIEFILQYTKCFNIFIAIK